MKINISDFISSLKFHAKTINNGGIYVKIDSSGLELASLPDTTSQTWCLEKLDINILDDQNVQPIEFYLDKQAIQSFLASVHKIKSKDCDFEVIVENNILSITNPLVSFKTSVPNTKFPTFYPDKEYSVFTEIKSDTWTIIKKMSEWIRPSSYFKAIYGVFVDNNGYIYAADTNTVYISGSAIKYDNPFFIPLDLIHKDLSGPVIIKTNNKSVIISFSNIEFLINAPFEGNLITNNTVFPVDEPRKLIESYRNFHDTLWKFNYSNIESINNAFTYYKITNSNDDPKFNISIYNQDDRCKLSVVSKNSNIVADLTSNEFKHNKSISLNQTAQIFFSPFLGILDKGNSESECILSVLQDSRILSLWSNNTGIITELLVLTSNISLIEKNNNDK